MWSGEVVLIVFLVCEVYVWRVGGFVRRGVGVFVMV